MLCIARNSTVDLKPHSVERAILLCHSVNVRSVLGLSNGVCVCILPCNYLSLCSLIFLHQHCDWLKVAVFKPDWLDVYTSEGG